MVGGAVPVYPCQFFIILNLVVSKIHAKSGGGVKGRKVGEGRSFRLIVITPSGVTLACNNQCLPIFSLDWKVSHPAHFYWAVLGMGTKKSHWGENGKNFKYWMGIQLSAASAKKFRKLSRSPIWGVYSVAVVYNAGIDRVTGNS